MFLICDICAKLPPYLACVSFNWLLRENWVSSVIYTRLIFMVLFFWCKFLFYKIHGWWNRIRSSKFIKLKINFILGFFIEILEGLFVRYCWDFPMVFVFSCHSQPRKPQNITNPSNKSRKAQKKDLAKNFVVVSFCTKCCNIS